MMGNAWEVALYLAGIAILAFLGGAAPLIGTWSRDRLALLLSFAGGVLLGAAFMCMLPVAASGLGEWVGAPFLAGFLAIFVLQNFLLVHPCGEEDCEIHSIGVAAFAGISFHGLLDGLAVSTSLFVPRLAAPIFLAIALHKMPAAFSLSSILLLARYSRRRTLVHIFFFSLTTPVGAILSYLFLRAVGEGVLAVAVGVSAGTFLAIATSDILPQLHQAGRYRAATLLCLLAGIALMAASERLSGP